MCMLAVCGKRVRRGQYVPKLVVSLKKRPRCQGHTHGPQSTPEPAGARRGTRAIVW